MTSHPTQAPSTLRRVAILDACVLYPATLRDFLLCQAAGGVYTMRLTDAIHDEWVRNVLEDFPNLTAAQLARTRALMNQITAQTLVTGYEPLIDTLTLPDPDDRHVLAATIHASADVIVTFNLKDFPSATLAGYGIVAESPDTFMSGLMSSESKRSEVFAQARRARLNLKNPPKAVAEYLAGLRRVGLPRTATLLEKYPDKL